MWIIAIAAANQRRRPTLLDNLVKGGAASRHELRYASHLDLFPPNQADRPGFNLGLGSTRARRILFARAALMPRNERDLEETTNA